MSNDQLEAFKQWVTHNARPSTVPHINNTASSEITLHVKTMLAIADGQPVVPNSKLIGTNIDAALRADYKVQLARASGDQKALQQALEVSPATGCAMVLSLAQQASGYNPMDPSAPGNLNCFLAYINQILLCPVFSSLIRDQVAPNMSGNWNSVIDSIVGFYPGLAGDQENDLRNGLWSLARAASSWPSANQTQNLFVQNTINSSADLTVYLYKSFINMRTDVQSGGKHSPDTVTNNASLSLWRAVLKFDINSWPSYAPIIMDKTNTSLEGWLNGNNVSKGPVAINWIQ